MSGNKVGWLATPVSEAQSYFNLNSLFAKFPVFCLCLGNAENGTLVEGNSLTNVAKSK